MNQKNVSKITCIADSSLSPIIESVLHDMAIPEAFIQRGKQVALLEKKGAFGIASRTITSESRADIYRLYVPSDCEAAVARRIAEAADLYLPGHGSLFAEDAEIFLREEMNYDEERISSACVAKQDHPHERHTVLCCIVQRGMGESLARTVLDMGLCVPVISYGEGMGLRNKLGLLRITIPVQKEVLYFIVPERDAALLESLVVHKARLDRPGQGFIYRFGVRAYAVNLRVRIGKRDYAASMEQVISALDDIRGSSEWRRFGAKKQSAKNHAQESKLVCLSLVADDGSVGDFVRAAMDKGAGGATVVPLTRRSYADEERSGYKASNARESCDLIVDTALSGAILNAVHEMGLYGDTVHGMAELSHVENAVTYTG